MFELDHDKLDIVAITNIGPDDNRVMLFDHFYKDPDAVRRLALKKREGLIDPNKPEHSLDLQDLQKNLRPLFDQICFDKEFWINETDPYSYGQVWDRASFMCEYITEKDFLNEPLKIMPSQSSYPHIPSPFQFKLEVYLNTNDETKGGTDLYSFLGSMTIPKPNLDKWQDDKDFDNMNMQLKSSFAWKVEHAFPMEYNRAILYKTQLLSCPELQKGWFRHPETPRLTQTLYM